MTGKIGEKVLINTSRNGEHYRYSYYKSNWEQGSSPTWLGFHERLWLGLDSRAEENRAYWPPNQPAQDDEGCRGRGMLGRKGATVLAHMNMICLIGT